MSENYQYAECKHCGKSVMEGEIHSCRKMLLAEIEELKERVEKWKTWHGGASEDAKKWRRDAQRLFGIMHNDILSAMEDCIELNMSAEQMRDIISHIIGKTLADRP